MSVRSSSIADPSVSLRNHDAPGDVSPDTLAEPAGTPSAGGCAPGDDMTTPQDTV
jgi:hypothetical protein